MALHFPPFYLLRFGFENKIAALQDLELEIGFATLTYNNVETNLFVGNVSKAKRAAMELKGIGVRTEPVVRGEAEGERVLEPKRKRRRVGGEEEGMDGGFVCVDSDTASQNGTDEGAVVVRKLKEKGKAEGSNSPVPSAGAHQMGGDTVKVLRLDWYTDSVMAGRVLPMEKYLVYEGRRIEKVAAKVQQPTKLLQEGILYRARADPPPPASFAQVHGRIREHAGKQSHSLAQGGQYKRAHLISQTTSEHEEASNIPPLPDYLHTPYSCQRPTPSSTPNDPFISLLRKILRVRQLQDDNIGVRAYNAAISSIAAYPYTITTVEEILRLPGCGEKYAAMYMEWKDTGHIREVDESENDERLQVLNLFYGIHDVAGRTAKKFYDRGWRTLDDVIECGWSTLTREQQAGLKYYADFQEKIPRAEVEAIGNTVLEYANRLRPRFQMVICGGYRRGKSMCGDVDIILTNPDEDATSFFIKPLLDKLIAAGYITCTLSTSDRTSERDQNALEWKGAEPHAGPRTGFDTLDKALVAWQDPEWPSMEEDLERDRDAKNPNPNRRVDIILSPWKTAGCAVVGWSGATMFERDLRIYCKEQLGYKFDSSGVRDRENGDWVDLEGDEMDLLAKEKKVFEGLKLDWIEPTLRCTDG